MWELFQKILLYMLAKMEKDRSLLAPFYILQGKQSIQTIQDANLYQLNRFFGLYKRISKKAYNQALTIFLQKEWLRQRNQSYELTKAGLEALALIDNDIKELKVNGKAWHQKTEIFYYRFLLLVQVWTNRKVNLKNYVPIIEDKQVEWWVKGFYRKTHQDVEGNLQALYEELIDILSGFDEKSRLIFIEKITNAYEIGASNQQLQEQFDLAKEDLDLMLIHVLHYLLTEMQQDKHPLLCQIARVSEKTQALTNSAEKTAKLLKEGYDVEKIAFMRQLKESTIYDHVVEIALHDENFPYELYLAEETISEIERAVFALDTYKLKTIKEAVSEAITYFQIRLVLTKLQKEVRMN